MWQRDRGCLRPAHVLYAIMTMSVSGTHGYRQVLEYLKRTVGERLGWDRTPFPSSLSEARRKLTPEVCKEAFLQVRSRMTLSAAGSRVDYRGYRLVAVDMTTLALPPGPEVEAVFRSPVDNKNRKAKAPKATLTALWDVSTNIPLDWKLEPCYASERFAAYELITQLGVGDLLLADRGHASRRMLIDLQARGAAYLIRMPLGKAGGFKEVHAFSQDATAWDTTILLHTDKQRTGSPTLAVRLVKKLLPSGEIAVFATNLVSVTDHPSSAICDLYCYRWDIETAFREMKIWHGLENFHARFANGIHQEVTALMIFMLLTAELEHQAKVHHHAAITAANAAAAAAKATITTEQPIVRNHVNSSAIRFNRRLIAECVGHLLIAATHGSAAFDAEYTNCMHELWKFRQKKRPGRTFPRIAKSPNSKWTKNTYNTKK
jgi:hypothetical protein